MRSCCPSLSGRLRLQQRESMSGLLLLIASRKKENEQTKNSPGKTYSSRAVFYPRNGFPLQKFTVDAVTGVSFTTPQETKVKIPADAFRTTTGDAVTGNVTVEF